MLITKGDIQDTVILQITLDFNMSESSSNTTNPLILYMRSLVKNKLPKIDNDGFIYKALTGQVGTISANNRNVIHKDELVEKYVHNQFPQYPRYCIPTAKLRALQAKGQGMWTNETIIQAASCFVIPDETEFLIIWPDLMDRFFLRKDPAFLKPVNEAVCSEQGIMTPCPYCFSNISVKFKAWNVVEHQRVPRMVVKGDGTKQPILSPVYTCSSLDCNQPNGKYNETKEFRTTRKFNIYSKEVFAQYPEAVRRRYGKYVTGLGITPDGTTLASPGLCLTILDDHQTFLGIAERLKEQGENRLITAKQRYYFFVEQYGVEKQKDINETVAKFFTRKVTNSNQPQKQKSQKIWPKFDEDMYKKLWGSIGEVAVQTIFHTAHDIIRPYLDRVLKTYMPGQIVSWDGTFSFAKRMMYDLLSEETPGAIIMLWGEYGHILFWAIAEDETQQHIKRINYFVRERARAAGKVDETKWAYSDVCCENYNNRQEHWFAKLWPKATEAPFKDPFHGIKMVCDSTVGPSHDLNNNFAAGMSNALFGFKEASIRDAVKDLKSKNPHLNPEEARMEVLRSSHYRKRMYNFVRHNLSAANDAMTLYEKTKKLDEDAATNARSKGEKYQRYFLDRIPGKRRGTQYEIENFVYHLRKGCYRDPLPATEMSYEIPRTVKKDASDGTSKMPILQRKRGTSGGESINKQVNRPSKNVSCISVKLADKRIAIRVFQLNYKKDVELEPLLKRKPLSLQYYLYEALKACAATIPHLEQQVATKFPPVQQL
jgi:hypothetical protein